MYSRALPSWRSWKEPPLISTPSREQELWGWASNGVVLTPPSKRPKTKDTRQSWGLRWHPMVIEGRREARAGIRRASPGSFCVPAWLSVQAETLDLSLVALPSPPTPSLLCNLFWHLQLVLPSLYASLSGNIQAGGPHCAAS